MQELSLTQLGSSQEVFYIMFYEVYRMGLVVVWSDYDYWTIYGSLKNSIFSKI